MPASVLASFLSFIIAGIYAWFVTGLDVEPAIKSSLFLSIFANSLYFFYFETITELDSSFQQKLRNVNVSQWILRVTNQLLLFSLWFILDLGEYGLLYFCIALILLYTLYIFWDFITKSCFDHSFLRIIDVIGLVLTIIFSIFLTFYEYILPGLPEGNSFDEFSFSHLWGVIVFIYFALPVAAILILEFNLLFRLRITATPSNVKLFSKDTWSKDKLT